MRCFFVLILALPFLASAQETLGGDCKLHRDSDPYTKETVLSTGFFSVDIASVDISANRFEIDLFFTVSNNCFDNNSTALIFFEGSKLKLTARNAGSMNCDGNFHIIFKNSATHPSLLQKMMNQKIAEIRLVGSNKKETVVSFLPDQQKFSELLKCLVTEGKKLIR